MEDFDKKLFPKEIKDGDIVVFKENKFEIQKEETKNKKEDIEALMKKLMKG